jgi:hypothetical protein
MADLGRPTLASLRRRLGDRQAAVLADVAWPGPSIMAAAAKNVDELLAPASRESVDTRRLALAIARLQAGATLRYAEFVLCCAGAGTAVPVDGVETCIVDSTALTMLLTNGLPNYARDAPRSVRLAFAITHAVVSLADEPSGIRRANLLALSTFVVETLDTGNTGDRTARSLSQLKSVEPLLRSLSVSAYLPYVTNLDASVIDPLVRLGVSPTSWIWAAVLTSGLRAAALDGDHQYLRRVDYYRTLAERHESACDVALGLIVNRLATSGNKRDQPALRELVVARWGDPRQRSAAPVWSRWATADGRRLVSSWMTRLVIDDFFATLSGHPERAAFWGRYAMAIDELWVYTSVDARKNKGEVVAKLRRDLEGHVHRMNDRSTNAFAMRIGEYVFVEFSERGNALYMYRGDSVPFDLNAADLQPRRMRDDTPPNRARLIHSGHWQERAHDEIGSRTGVWPSR